MSLPYSIHVVGRRLWVEHAVPVDHLSAITALACAVADVPKSKLVIVTDVGAKLGASIALCAKGDVAAWRAELGLPHPPPDRS